MPAIMTQMLESRDVIVIISPVIDAEYLVVLYSDEDVTVLTGCC